MYKQILYKASSESCWLDTDSMTSNKWIHCLKIHIVNWHPITFKIAVFKNFNVVNHKNEFVSTIGNWVKLIVAYD